MALVGEGKAVSVLLMSEVTGRLLLLLVMARRVLAIRGRRQLGACRQEVQTAATMTMARVAVARAKAALAVKLVKAQAASEAVAIAAVAKLKMRAVLVMLVALLPKCGAGGE